MTLPRYPLRTPEIEVHGVAVGRDVLSGLEEVLGVVGAELDNEGPVGGGVAVEIGRFYLLFLLLFAMTRRWMRVKAAAEGLEVVVAEILCVFKEAGVEHRRIG